MIEYKTESYTYQLSYDCHLALFNYNVMQQYWHYKKTHEINYLY